MAMANAWTTGQTCVNPVPQLRPSSSSTSSSSSSSSVINFTKKPFLRPFYRQSRKLYCCCMNSDVNNHNSSEIVGNSNNSKSYCASTAAEWDWNRWTRHFSEIEQAESYASVLKFQLEEAIEKEDFQEAAKLKTAIAEATSKDSVGEIMSQLQSAINDERYHEASKLCQSTGSGLVGWWVGYSKDSDDPFGRVVRITPCMGRFVGRSYSPRQLVTASPGTPLFEIFVVRDADETYTMQVTYLQQVKGGRTTTSSSTDSKPTEGQSSVEVENSSVVEVEVNDTEPEKEEEKSINIERAAEEGIRSVINFLKDKIPDLKVKVMNIKVTDEEDGDSIKQLMEDNKGNTISSENAEEDDSELDDVQSDELSDGGDSDTVEDEKDQDMKLFIGGVLHNKEDNPTKDDYVRVPADIVDMERDSFVLHIPKKPQDHDSKDNISVNVEVAAVAAQGISELMPSDVAKAFWSSDKISSKVSRDVREIIKLAVKQAQKRNTFSEYTNFSRITTSESDLDPFEGLYVGAFGPYGTEVVQLRRKYGNWNVKNADESSNVEFYEYVEAVKLTGDLNVPAGQVTFRAKIGKGNRSTNRGMYPDELGVVASYKGQGRIAEFGFKNPKLVEGELLQLNGKGLGPYVKGADLGFLYVIPEQSFLVLFNRLKLPE